MLLEKGVGLDQTCASRGIGYRQAMVALSTWLQDPASVSASSLVRPCRVAALNPCFKP